jgi:hypothetical protein
MKLKADQVQAIAAWAQDGHRVVADGKTIWAGRDDSAKSPFLGNQVQEDWKTKGTRFTNQLKKLEFEELQLQRFHRINPEHGRWAVHSRYGGSSGHDGFKVDPNGRVL